MSKIKYVEKKKKRPDLNQYDKLRKYLKYIGLSLVVILLELLFLVIGHSIISRDGNTWTPWLTNIVLSSIFLFSTLILVFLFIMIVIWAKERMPWTETKFKVMRVGTIVLSGLFLFRMLMLIVGMLVFSLKHAEVQKVDGVDYVRVTAINEEGEEYHAYYEYINGFVMKDDFFMEGNIIDK